MLIQHDQVSIRVGEDDVRRARALRVCSVNSVNGTVPANWRAVRTAWSIRGMSSGCVEHPMSMSGRMAGSRDFKRNHPRDRGVITETWIVITPPVGLSAVPAWTAAMGKMWRSWATTVSALLKVKSTWQQRTASAVAGGGAAKRRPNLGWSVRLRPTPGRSASTSMPKALMRARREWLRSG